MDALHGHALSRLHWELSVLSRAVAYQNLSSASMHIGTSQPQLSRIVSKLEQELKTVLLDRSSRRKSGWTPAALRLAELYMKSERRLEHDIQGLLAGEAQAQQVKFGTLEGFNPLAMQACNQLLRNPHIKLLELDVYDLDELERLFVQGDLDLIFTLREPSRRKYSRSRRLGFQHVNFVEKDARVLVMSTFEHGSRVYRRWRAKSDRFFVSNSLEIRKEWLRRFGGAGTVPASTLNERQSKPGDTPVYLIAGEYLSPSIWEQLAAVDFRLS